MLDFRAFTIVLVLLVLGQAALGQTTPDVAPSPGKLSADLVIWCYDSKRELVYRELAAECHGSAVSDAEARVIQSRRNREIQKAFTGSLPVPGTGGHTRRFGTAFFVDENGNLITNNHVVDECKEVDIETTDGKALPTTVTAVDVKHDLAILHASIRSPAVANFRSQALLDAGAPVSAIGYPDLGMPTREPVVTPAVTLALSPDQRGEFMAVRGDIRFGNSGSPIVDPYGLVVGVIRAKLNSVRIFSDTGSLPPDVGIGASLPAVFDLLKKNDIHYLFGREGQPLTSPQLLSESIRFMARVECQD
jgi:S1-C subfamily serine protease